jgi:hypothetical protein
MNRIIAFPQFKSIRQPALKPKLHWCDFISSSFSKCHAIALFSARILLIKGSFMMYRVLICIVALAGAFSLQAEVKLDSMTVGSVTYSNVTIFGANATDLFFSSDRGVSNVKLKYLSPDLQKQFDYNPTNSDQVEQQQIQQDKLFQQHMADGLTAVVRAEHQADQAQNLARYSAAGLGDPVSDDSTLGKPLTQFDSVKWLGPKPDLTGKFTIISIWSPTSASSRKWIPQLNDLHKALAGKVEMVGITTSTADEVAQADPKIDFPCALDPGGKFLKAAHVQSLPCVLLVDTNAMVCYQGHPAAVTTNTLQMLFNSDEETKP